MRNRVPVNWIACSLGSLGELSAGGTPSTRERSFWDKGTIRWMSSGEIHQKHIREVRGRITEKGYQNSNAKLLPIGTILIALAGQGKTRGTVGITEIELTTNQSVGAVELKHDKVLPLYLFYNLDRRYQELRRISLGDGRAGLNLNILRKLQILLPSLSEQKKIAEILSTWDRAIEMLDKLISAKTRLKKGLMQKLLTGKVRFKGYTNRFERALLGAIAKVNMGQSPSSAFYNTSAMGLPLIQGNADCKNRLTFPTTYTSEITKKAYIDDIIMSVRAPVGSIAKCTLESCIGRGVCSIRGDKIDNDYLYQFLLFCEPSWTSYAQGSTFTAVNGNDIRKLEVSFPSEQGERKKIARILSSVDRELDCLTHIQEKLKSQKQGLMQELLTGKVRVKI